ncbi:MAG TPA: hypothetical protein VF898_12555, partial [Chloroflexota bacterium]
MALMAGLIVSRLAFWSTIEHGRLAATALMVRSAALAGQPPVRGRIYDAQRNLLATDISVTGIAVIPKQIKHPIRTAELLSPILHKPVTYLDHIFTTYSGYVRLDSSVSPSVLSQVESLGLPGIVPDPEMKRTYPDGSLA